MVYGLEPSKINADKVFNIFCLYGNVERVSDVMLSKHLEPKVMRLFFLPLKTLYGKYGI